MKHSLTIIVTTTYFLLGCNNFTIEQSNSYNYPRIKADTAKEVYFGKEIIDPYRNIEDINSTEVKGWLKKQRDFCDSTLTNITNYASLKKEIEGYLNLTQIKGGFPRPVNEKLFYAKKFVNNNINKLYCYNEIKKDTIELFSTEELNEKTGSIHQIDYYEPSPNGNFIALGMYADGAEYPHIYILDVNKKQLLKEKIDISMCYSPKWLPDESGFFYFRTKELKTNHDTLTKFDDNRVYLHILGTKAQNDNVIVSADVTDKIKKGKIDFPKIYTVPTSDLVFFKTFEGVSSFICLYYTPLSDVLNRTPNQIQWNKLCDEKDKIKYFTPYENSVYFLSYKSSSNGKLIRININDPNKTETIFESNEHVLEKLIRTKKNLYVQTIHNGLNKILSIDFSNNDKEFIHLPFEGAIKILPNFPTDPIQVMSNKLYFNIRAWNKSNEIYSFDPVSKQANNMNILRPKSSPEQKKLIVKEVEVISHDGVKVPLSIIHNKNVKLNGKNPLVIYAYGAYGYSMLPRFKTPQMTWYERGIIYAVAHVRGGGEKGEEWHISGKKNQKPNSWRDLIACTEHLIKNDYTKPSKIIAKGSSAGGITIGRAIQERPDLFKGAVIKVGSLNPLRNEPNSKTSQINEYGTINDSIEFSGLFELDVYHNINDSIVYPSLYLTTGLNDRRVAAWQPGKVVARLQSSSNNNPVLFRVSKEGHFNGSDYSQELTDEYSFIFWQLGIEGFGYSNSH